MGLASELSEARAALARAKSEHGDFGLDQRGTGALAGSELQSRKRRVAEAQENLERVESDVLERARAIVEERDPEYAAKMRDAKLVDEVEKHAFIGAADRLMGE